MAETVVLTTQARAKGGSRESQKLRKQGLVPAVIYGHKETPENVAIPSDELSAALRHHARTMELKTGDKAQSVLIQDIQYDHLGKDVLHIDFLRVSATDKIHLTVPVELRGLAAGVKAGGVLIQPLHEVHIECLVSARPDSIRVKIDDLQLGQAIHIKELPVLEGVRYLHDADAVVVQVKTPSAQVEATTGLPGEGAAEPEVITKKKEKDDGAEE
jgi:large subunit ribosomal protein L25